MFFVILLLVLLAAERVEIVGYGVGVVEERDVGWVGFHLVAGLDEGAADAV